MAKTNYEHVHDWNEARILDGLLLAAVARGVTKLRFVAAGEADDWVRVDLTSKKSPGIFRSLILAEEHARVEVYVGDAYKGSVLLIAGEGEDLLNDYTFPVGDDGSSRAFMDELVATVYAHAGVDHRRPAAAVKVTTTTRAKTRAIALDARQVADIVLIWARQKRGFGAHAIVMNPTIRPISEIEGLIVAEEELVLEADAAPDAARGVSR